MRSLLFKGLKKTTSLVLLLGGLWQASSAGLRARLNQVGAVADPTYRIEANGFISKLIEPF
jgi:hypothetical protein